MCGQSSKERPQARRDRPWGVVSPRDTLRIGCVNVTSMGKEMDGRAELAVDTLQQYKLAVCGLSEVRLGESGKRRIGGYTVFYSGRKKGTYGVRKAVQNRLAQGVTAWEAVSDRIMWLRFNAKSVPTTFIQCYASTEASTTEAKERFHKALGKVMREVHGRDYLVVMGDFNARVGNDWRTGRE